MKRTEMKRALADLLHTLRCKKQHLTQMEQIDLNDHSRCAYYLEESIHEMWEMPAHELWLNQAEDLMKELNLTSYHEALNVMSRIVTTWRDIRDLIEVYPSAREMLISFLRDQTDS